uniref:Putative alanyl-trna editing protein aarsd1-b n=1 Tax=Rhipicephalus microplus TaxID=6941 RepID=A0A6M2CN26_RHIMP
MIFACQRDSYLRSFKTRVVACNPVVDESAGDVYEVVFEDTVLFPEGGGQPDDRGLVGDVPVLRVFRRAGEAVHVVCSAIAVGAEVEMSVDWKRRYDHMQQHSGQHLITALAEQHFDFLTTSWNLGEEVSFIELDAPMGVKEEDLRNLESLVNEKIRQGLPVHTNLYEAGSDALQSVRTRLKLPDGGGDVIRVVTIEGVDSNTCCGTHVSNLAHLQMVKLLYTEKGKQKKTNLYFLVGNRILQYLDKTVSREKVITSVLKCGPDDHASMAEKLSKSLKLANKNLLTALRDLAVAEAKLVKQQEPLSAFYTFHRREADAEFMAIFANELSDKDVLLFLTCGDEKGSGQFLVSGPENIVATTGPKVCELLDGKGFLKHGKFQGKARALSGRGKVEKLLMDMLDNK